MRISVVLPVFNAEGSLRPCLDSVLRQTMPDVGVIAVDDGSTDGSAAVLAEYEAANPDRVTVIRTANHGANRARNAALRQVAGDYVMFLDSDDSLEPDMCARLYAQAAAGRDDIVLCGAYDGAGVSRAGVPRVGGQDFRLLDRGHELLHISPFPWAKLFRRGLLAGLEFPELSGGPGNDGRYADLAFVLRACCRAARIGVVREPLYHYRRTAVRGFSRRTLDVVRAFALVTGTLREDGVLDRLRAELECLCALHFLHRYPRVFRRAGDVDLKMEFIGATQGFLEREYPGWRANRYLRRCSGRARAFVGFGASASRMTRLVHLRERVPDPVARYAVRQWERVDLLAELY